MVEDRAPKPWRAMLFGLVVICLLTCIPVLLLTLVGKPGSTSPEVAITRPGPAGPIAGPALRPGLSPSLTQGILLSAVLSLALAVAVGLAIWIGRRRFWAGSAMPISTRLLLLSTLGAASLALYEIAFMFPFPLQRYYQFPGIGPIADRDARVALAATLATIAPFVLCGLAYGLVRGQRGRALWTIVLTAALLFSLANLLTAITTTLDPYDYIARGRITAVHGGNPYLWTPGQYPTDPFMQYVSWRDKTSAYAPLWETLSALLGRFAGDRLLPQLLAYKLLTLVCYLGSVALVAAILRRTAPERALAGTLLFAWNPLILMEGVGNAHNDMLMLLLLLGALYFLQRALSPGHPDRALDGVVAILLLGAGVLVKFVPILLLPIFLACLLANRKGWGRRIAMGLLLLLPLALLFAMYYLPFWASWGALADTFGRRVEMFRMTITSIAKEGLQQLVAEKTAEAAVRWPLLGLFALSYLVVVSRALLASLFRGRAWSRFVRERLLPRPGLRGELGRLLAADEERWESRPWGMAVRAGMTVLLLYLLLGNFWWWPWYLIWPIALLPLLDEERLVVPLAFLAACAGELSHLAWNFLWFWWGITWETTYQIDGLVVLSIIVPALLVYALPSFIRARKQGTLGWFASEG